MLEGLLEVALVQSWIKLSFKPLRNKFRVKTLLNKEKAMVGSILFFRKMSSKPFTPGSFQSYVVRG